MYSSFFRTFIIILITTILLNIIFTSYFSYALLNNNQNTTNLEVLVSDDSLFFWPLPNNYRITSYFGRRNAPTQGASTYHSGLDIAATEGTKLYSCISGTVTFLGFSGAGRLYYNCNIR